MKKTIRSILLVPILLLFIFSSVDLWANGITISGSLKHLNRDSRVTLGTAGNALIVWNQSKSNNPKYGKIYAVEINRQANGIWLAGDPFLVFSNGQRPSLTYLPVLDQYAIYCDTGLSTITEVGKEPKPSKILVRRYTPSTAKASRDSGPGLSKVVTLVDANTIAVSPITGYLGPSAGFERCYLAFAMGEKPNQESGQMNPADNNNAHKNIQVRFNDFSLSLTLQATVVDREEAYAPQYSMVIDESIYFSGLTPVVGDHKTQARIMEVDTTNFQVNFAPLSNNENSFNYARTSIAPITSGFVGMSNATEDHQPVIIKYDVGLKQKFDFKLSAKYDVSNFYATPDNTRIDFSPFAKKSDTYLIFATKDGKVRYTNLTFKGKPTKAVKVFKVKKNRFGSIDAEIFNNEALVVYSEFKNKSHTKSQIKLTNFKVK